VEIKLLNTMGRKKEVFKPINKEEVRMYCCGPTVYNYAHIGNLRTYIFEDVLRRVLEFNGFKVKHVMNITDVGHLTSDADTGEDKMEVGAKRERKTVWEIAEFYTKAFFEDTQRLNILKPTIVCKATDHIKEMIELIQRLEKKGYTYIIEDGIYYDTSKFKDYGKLTGMNFEELQQNLKAGARVEFNPEKRNITDFALWKFSPKDKKRQMEWDFTLELIVSDEEYKRLENISKKNPNVQILEVRDV
jgi:cysteinyl-tRNA synthetase